MDDNNRQTILLIDGLNEFMRNFVVNPMQSATTGELIGGTFGFLRTLSFLVYKIRPDKVVIAWEGKDSSKKRKKILPEYKLGRKTPKLNRFYEETEDDVLNSKREQLALTLKYINLLPIHSVLVEGLEGDDIIGYLTTEHFKDDKKIIVSNDKDFFQLLCGPTVIYRTIKREYVNKKYILSKFNILPENFAIAKSIQGDPSDNISGVKGIGFKTMIKLFPELSEKVITIDDLVNTANAVQKKSKLLERFLDNIDTVKTNYRVIGLDNKLISLSQINKIEFSLNKELKYDKMKILEEVMKDGITKLHFNWSNVFAYLLNNK